MDSFENPKRLKFVITLATGTFENQNGANQITNDSLRMVCNITKAGGMQMSELDAQIYGMSESDTNSVTTLQWKPDGWIKNTIEVFAIDGDITSLVFAGNIINAIGEKQNMPNASVHIIARAGFANQIVASKPRSFAGGSSVAVVMEQLAKSMGYAFESNNTNIIVNDIYLSGSPMEQARDLANMANCEFWIDDHTLSIAPRNNPREKTAVVISPESGMIKFPIPDAVGVTFSCIYNPAILFGGLVQVISSLPQCAGTWIVSSMSHQLESLKPGGMWKSTIRGSKNGLVITR